MKRTYNDLWLQNPKNQCDLLVASYMPASVFARYRTWILIRANKHLLLSWYTSVVYCSEMSGKIFKCPSHTKPQFPRNERETINNFINQVFSHLCYASKGWVISKIVSPQPNTMMWWCPYPDSYNDDSAGYDKENGTHQSVDFEVEIILNYVSGLALTVEDGGTIRCHRQLPAARKDKETHHLSRSLWKGHSRANAVSLAGWTPFQTSDHKSGEITVLLLCCYKPQSSVSFATAASNYYRLYMHASSLEWAFYWQEEDIVTRLLPRSLSSLELQKSHLTHQIEVFKYSPMIN